MYIDEAQKNCSSSQTYLFPSVCKTHGNYSNPHFTTYMEIHQREKHGVQDCEKKTFRFHSLDHEDANRQPEKTLPLPGV